MIFMMFTSFFVKPNHHAKKYEGWSPFNATWRSEVKEKRRRLDVPINKSRPGKKSRKKKSL
jgi:hypothetical protein